MKKLSLFAIILISSQLIAQDYEYNSSFFRAHVDNSIMYLIPGVKNQTVDIKTVNQKNGKVSMYRKQFDEKGNTLKYAKIKEGEEVLINLNTFTEEGKKKNIKKYKKGKLKSEHQYEWSPIGGISAWSEFDGKGELKKSSKWTYQSKDCPLSSQLYKGKEKKLHREWNYEYYDACDKKRSILRNGKGKVLKQWTYDCKEEGEILTKKKDVTQVCKWEKTDNEILTKVYQTFDEKGKVIKRVYQYRLQDTAIVNMKVYNENDVLKSESKYDYSYNKPLMYVFYRKGKKKYGAEYTYEGDKIKSYTNFYKNSKYKNEYIYNEDDQLTEMKYYRNSDELTKLTTIAYKN